MASMVTLLPTAVNPIACYNGPIPILDITIESLDRSIVESGLAYDRGQTRSGSRICEPGVCHN